MGGGPNFLLVGAPKTGSTSVAKYLAEHPDIFIPEQKELFYFIKDSLREVSKKDPMYDAVMSRAIIDRDAYFSMFENAKEQLRGEATVHYLYHHDEVIPRVKAELGDIKIILLLRNPVNRAFSNFNYQQRGQTCSFEEALDLESERKAKGYNSFWYYKEVGLYSKPVAHYMKAFSSVKVCLFEDMKADPLNFMKELYTFLGVDASFTPNVSEVHNKTNVPKNRLWHRLIHVKHRLGVNFHLPTGLKSAFYKESDRKLSRDTEKMLRSFFKNDIQQLEQLLGRNLSSWYQ